MKRALLILVAGFALSLLLGAGTYYWRTARQRAMLCSDQPELAWLKQEFQLNDAQFARMGQLHNAYMSQCAELCKRIVATNALIRAEIASHAAVTPELEKLLADAAQLRIECQGQMLGHFFQVSHEMSPEQGKRFLAWVQEQIFTMPHEQMPSAVPPSKHDH
jgi:hypothetical protein